MKKPKNQNVRDFTTAQTAKFMPRNSNEIQMKIRPTISKIPIIAMIKIPTIAITKISNE